MKALAVIVMLLVVGDLVFDHGAAVVMIGHAGSTFAHDAAQSFSDSMFSA